jgi:copper chaperone CopZ
MRNVIVLILFIFFVSCQNVKNNKGESSGNQSEAIINEEVLNIGKMHCEMCVASIEKGLKGLEGVEFVKVDLEDSTAFIKYNTAKTNVVEFKKVIEKRGYILKN